MICALVRRMSGERMRLLKWQPIKRWATLPSRPQLKDGQLARDGGGKPLYEPTAAWIDVRLGAAFGARVCQLVAGADPGAFTPPLDLEPATSGLLPGVAR